MAELFARTYGDAGAPVVALHGGPGTPGTMAPVARELADRFRVIEPFQRESGGERLTVALHVADLRELIESRCGDARPALVGHSWGAMLALAFAADHGEKVGSLVLIGCGTFDPRARERMRQIREERMDRRVRRRMERLVEEFPDPDERLLATGRLLAPLYSYDPIPGEDEVESCDARGHRETWDDMLRSQEKGVYPAAFARITIPVLMLHGAWDPHPGAVIRAGLEPYLPQLEYREWERCGHTPWREKAAREEFFAVLGDWLARHAG